MPRNGTSMNAIHMKWNNAYHLLNKEIHTYIYGI